MAKGKDTENFVVLSRVRTGLKRELEFALKAQSEIGGSLGRTRSRKAQDEAIASPERRSSKRLKMDVKVKKGKDGEAECLEKSDGVVEDSVDFVSEEEAESSDVDHDEPKGDGDRLMDVSVSENYEDEQVGKEGELKDGTEKPMCDENEKDGDKKDGPAKVLVSFEEIENTPEKALKTDVEEEEKDQEEASTVVSQDAHCEAETEKENQPEKKLSDFEEGERAENSNKDQSEEIEPENLMNGEKQKVKTDFGRKVELQNGNEEVSDEKPISAVGVADNCKVENVFDGKSPRRFTRSSLQPDVELVKKTSENDAEQTADFKSGVDGNFEGIHTSLNRETNSTNNVGSNSIMRLKDLLDSGILEGNNVRYMRHSKNTRGSGVNGLQGVISGSGILCFCDACEGAKVVSPTVYELHAGSSNKRPPDYIQLENGKTLGDVMNVWNDNPSSSLEEALRIAIGPSMKKSNFCFNCRGSITRAAYKKTLILCSSCLELKEPQVNPTEGADTSHRSPKPTIVTNSSPEPNIVTKSSPEPTIVTKSSYSATNGSSSQAKTKGKVTRKDLRMHKLVFEEHGLPEGTELAYFVRGQKCLVGYKKGFGILCTCCNTEVSPSQFEAHAGYASRRKPFQHIYTSNGVSLHELSISLSKDRKVSSHENDDLCSICLDGGDLLCCDTCPRAFHRECALLPQVPTGAWYCRYCQSMFQREKFVQNNANAVAAGRVEGVDPIEQITKRCIRIVETPVSEDPSVCVLCRGHNFSKTGFGPLTVILCDQCEKEYHVGCLRDENIADLKELPEGKWFCSIACSVINSALHKLVVRGEEKLSYSALTTVKKNCEEIGSESKTDADVRWRVLGGKMASLDDNRVLLSKAVAIFHDRFDPISDSGLAKGDLIPAMVYGKTRKGQDFGGMYCAILTVNQVVVSAAIFRIFGQEVAELPLAATSSNAQGKGYFQCLFSCIEKLLGFLKVKILILPAADEVESIWTKKFGFIKMPQDDVTDYQRDYQMMVFQGTSMLWKPVPGIMLKSEAKKEHG